MNNLKIFFGVWLTLHLLSSIVLGFGEIAEDYPNTYRIAFWILYSIVTIFLLATLIH